MEVKELAKHCLGQDICSECDYQRKCKELKEKLKKITEPWELLKLEDEEL